MSRLRHLLAGRTLIRLKLDGPTAGGQEHPLKNAFGRLRDVAQAADGSVYVITSGTEAHGPGRPGGDRLLRPVPAAR